MMIRRLLSGLILAAFLGCTDAREAAPPQPSVVAWSATETGARQLPDGGQVIDVELTGNIDEGWKLYSLTQKGETPSAMTVNVKPDAVLDGEVIGPAPTRTMDPNFGTETETYAGSPVFRLAVKIPAGADSRKPVELQIKAQACSDKICLNARTTTVDVKKAPGTT